MLRINYEGTLRNAAGVQLVHSPGSDKDTTAQPRVRLGHTITGSRLGLFNMADLKVILSWYSQ